MIFFGQKVDNYSLVMNLSRLILLKKFWTVFKKNLEKSSLRMYKKIWSILDSEKILNVELNDGA